MDGSRREPIGECQRRPAVQQRRRCAGDPWGRAGQPIRMCIGKDAAAVVNQISAAPAIFRPAVRGFRVFRPSRRTHPPWETAIPRLHGTEPPRSTSRVRRRWLRPAAFPGRRRSPAAAIPGEPAARHPGCRGTPSPSDHTTRGAPLRRRPDPEIPRPPARCGGRSGSAQCGRGGPARSPSTAPGRPTRWRGPGKLLRIGDSCSRRPSARSARGHPPAARPPSRPASWSVTAHRCPSPTGPRPRPTVSPTPAAPRAAAPRSRTDRGHG